MAEIIWKCRVPLKIKIFLWQLSNNKLQVAVNLAKKKVEGIYPLLSLWVF